jgi:hypothetical protein
MFEQAQLIAHEEPESPPTPAELSAAQEHRARQAQFDSMIEAGRRDTANLKAEVVHFKQASADSKSRPDPTADKILQEVFHDLEIKQGKAKPKQTFASFFDDSISSDVCVCVCVCVCVWVGG